MKPSPERLVLESYPFVRTIPTRSSDLDAQWHLNNVAVAQIYSDARARMQLEQMGKEILSSGERLLVVNVSISYLREGFYPDDVAVGCAVVTIGRTSLTIGQGLFQYGTCIGTADVVLVFCRDDGPAPISGHLRARFQKLRLRNKL